MDESRPREGIDDEGADDARAFRMKLTGAVDTTFFGCFSVLVAFVAAALAITPLVLVLGRFGYHSAGAVMLGALCVFLATTALFMWRTVFVYIDVGADGIVVRRRFGRDFVPYGKILGVDQGVGPTGGQLLVFHLDDGSTRTARVDTLSASKRAWLFERVRRAVAAFRAIGAAERGLELLDRRARSVASWRKELAAKVARGSDYRSAFPSADRVIATLENVAASRGRRIGAALAMIAGEESDAEEARRRIRVVATECADARLRIALESIASDALDEAAVDEAASDDEGSRTRARR